MKDIRELHANDPFRAIAVKCRIPPSYVERLRSCRFHFQMGDDEPPLFPAYPRKDPAASSGVSLLSPPENLGEKQNGGNLPREAMGEVFHAPPEVTALAGSSKEQLLQQEPVASVEGVGKGGEIEAIDGDRTAAVDLGRDMDLGFSLETELTERIEIDSGVISSPGVCRAPESEVIDCESTEVRVSKRKSLLNEVVRESPVKMPRLAGRDLETEQPGSALGTCLGKKLETWSKIMAKLKSPLNKSKILDKNMELEPPSSSLAAEAEKSGFQQSKGGAGSNEDRCNSNIDCEAKEACTSREKNAARKCIDDIDKFRYVGPSSAHLRETEKGAKGKRVLPPSLLGKGNAMREGVECEGARSSKNYKELTLVALLRILGEMDRHDDPSLEKLSILDCAKMRGMTFP